MTMNKDNVFMSEEEIREQVRQAVAEGENISREVERITGEALELGRVEFDRLQAVIENIGRGASAGASEQPDNARRDIKAAFEGLQNALLHAFENAKLATQEQAARVEGFYEKELKLRLQEMQQMEKTMLDSLSDAARAGTDTGAAALNDLVDHARRSGTRLGEEVDKSMRTMAKSLPEALRETALAGMSVAREATARAAEVASGVLSGVADTLHKDKTPANKKGSNTDGQY
ncbi:MAG: DUF6781 family protein [Gammaproteobacteria bacterium]